MGSGFPDWTRTTKRGLAYRPHPNFLQMSRRTWSKLQMPVVGIWRLTRYLRQAWLGCFYRAGGKIWFERLGKDVRFNGWVCIEKPFSKIFIGDGCLVGKRCYFLAEAEGEVRIGKKVLINDQCYITSIYGVTVDDGCMIAENVSIRDYDHCFDNLDRPISAQGYKGGRIHIGEGTWVGRGVMITSGVKIGRGCVIGANAVVTRDLPDFSIAAGVPARVMRLRSETNQSPIA